MDDRVQTARVIAGPGAERTSPASAGMQESVRGGAFRSLRWRLQFWHALILLSVIVGFGSVISAQAGRASMNDVDTELHAAARLLEGALRAFPQWLLRGERGPPPFRDESRPSPRQRGEPGARGEPGFRGEQGPPPPRSREFFLAALTLPITRLDPEDASRSPYYFVIWDGQGKVLKDSVSANAMLPLDMPWPPERDAGPSVSTGEPLIRQRDSCREIFLDGPEGHRILVGKFIGHERAAMRRLSVQLALTGLAVFGGGLLGGWWLSGRAVQPVRIISETAATVTGTSLDQRIDPSRFDSEFRQLSLTLNEMLDRLQSTIEQQHRFTADASHELRTPLSVILAQLELSLSRPRTLEEYRSALSICQETGQRMASLVDDLLLLARADVGHLAIQPVRADLAALAAEAIGQLEPIARAAGVRMKSGQTPVWAVCDRNRMMQVLFNLTGNAIRYNRPGGSVWVEIDVEGPAVRLRVSDDGIGIPAADLPRVFDRFFCVDRARSRQSGGTGLGLAICQSIIAAHGGTIAATSEPGRGTTMEVLLPQNVRQFEPGTQDGTPGRPMEERSSLSGALPVSTST